MEKPSHSPHDDEKLSLNIGASTEVLYRPTSSVTHRRSNTVPSRYRKPDTTVQPTQQTTHLSPTYKRNENLQQQSASASQPFSPSLLSTQPRRRIRVIDDTDDADSLASSMAVRDD